MGKLLRAVTTLVLLLAVHSSAAQSTPPGQEIVGAWAIDVRPDALPPDAPPLHTITVFDRGYGVTGLIGRLLPPIPPIQAVANEIGPMSGLWRRTGAHTFEFTIYTVMMRNGIVT